MRSHDERMAALTARRDDVQSALNEARRQRMEAAAELRSELAEDAAARHAAVAEGLAASSRARAEMSANQRASLAKATANRQAEVRGMRADTQSAMREVHAQREALHAAVATTLGGFHAGREELAANLAEFSQVWQSFTETMQARRAGRMPNAAANQVKQPAQPRSSDFTFERVHHPEPWVAVKPVQAKPKPKAAPDAASEAVVEAATVPPDESVFSYLADHPDGLRLVELEEHFGTLRIRLKDILNRLIEQNKARKDDERKLFFAT